jgi:hypothetical protein
MDIVRGSANSEMSVGVGVRSRQSRRRREKKSHTSSRVRIVTRARGRTFRHANLPTRLSRRRATVRRALGRLLGLFLLRVVGQSFIRPRVFVVVHAREKARVDTARAAP